MRTRGDPHNPYHSHNSDVPDNPNHAHYSFPAQH